MVDLARQHLETQVRKRRVAVVGGRDQLTYDIVCEMLEHGLSDEMTAELMREIWAPAGDDLDEGQNIPEGYADLIEWKMASALNPNGGMQNEPGCRYWPDPAVWKVEQYAPRVEPTVEPASYNVANGAAQDDDEGFPIFDTWQFRDRPQPTWQIEGLIRDKSQTILFGQSEAFKTFLLIDLLASVATGLPAFGAREIHRTGDAVLCLDEDPDDAMRGRFPAWCKARGIHDPFRKPLRLPNGEPSPGRYVTVPSVPLVSDPGQVETLIRQIRKRGLKPAIIGIDTAAKAMGGLNQNDAKDVGLLVAAMTRLRREFGCSVVAIHHPPKDRPREMRGSGAFTNDVDTIILAERIGGTYAVELTFEKLKGAPKQPPFCVKAAMHDVGMTDAAGRPLTYPAFTQASGEAVRQAKAVARNSSSQDGAIVAKRSLAIDALCRITKGEVDYVAALRLAMEMYPQQTDEAPEDYTERMKSEAEELGRCAKGAASNRRGKRPDLSDLIKRDKNGSPLRTGRSLRFCLPDRLRRELDAF